MGKERKEEIRDDYMLAGGYSEEALGIKVSADVNEAISEITKLNKLLAVTSQGINEFGAAGGKGFGSFNQQLKEGFAGLHQFNEGMNAYTDYTKLSIPIQKEATAGLHQFNEGVNAYADYTNIGKQATYDFQTSQRQGISITKEFNSKMAEGKKRLREIISEEKRFKAEGLNYLFFGMQIQRTFGGIMFSGINTFRSITEATEGTITNLTILGNSFEFLSFTVGDAINTFLEPFMGVLINIIDGIADFIQQNPEITALVITFGALAGTLMFVKGTIQVFTDNVRAAKDAIFFLNGALGKAGLSGALTTIEGLFGGGLGLLGPIGIIAAFAVLSYILFNEKDGILKGMDTLQQYLEDTEKNAKKAAEGIIMWTEAELRRKLIYEEGFREGTMPSSIEQMNENVRRILGQQDITAPNMTEYSGFNIPRNITIEKIEVNVSPPFDPSAIEYGRAIGAGTSSELSKQLAAFTSASTIR